MSDTFSADPAALTAHARRLASYQSDLEQASDALRQASRGRTVLSVSHRVYESLGGRTVEIKPQTP